MRRGRIIGVAAAAAALFLLSASAALAATPRQIYADLADNGKLDNTYTRADLQNAALDASVQGYGGTVGTTLTSQVLGAQAGGHHQVCGSKAGTSNGSTSGGMNGTSVCSHVCTGTASSAKSGTSRGGVNGASASSSQNCGHVLAAQHTAAGTLPFTGAQLTLFLLIGLALISSGLLLRRTARENSRS